MCVEQYCSDSAAHSKINYRIIEYGGLALAPDLGDRNWRPIAEQVTKQMSPTTLAILLAELRKTLEEQELLQQPQTESDWGLWRDAPLVFFN